MARHVIIGDIHGLSEALDALLDTVGLRDDDIVVFVGDLVDRGPDSAGVVKRARALSERRPVVLIKGNHEAKHERYRRARALSPDHAGNVRGSRELEAITRALSPEDLEFLEAAALWYRAPDGSFCVVHAGVPPLMEQLPGEAQPSGDGRDPPGRIGPASLLALPREQRAWAEQMLRIRWVRGSARVELVVQGGLPLGEEGGAAAAPSVGESATISGRVLRRDFRPKGEYLPLGTESPDDPYWADIYEGNFGHVYFGHNPFTGREEPVRFPHATALDLGAIYGGSLAAAVLEPESEPRFVTVATQDMVARHR